MKTIFNEWSNTAFSNEQHAITPYTPHHQTFSPVHRPNECIAKLKLQDRSMLRVPIRSDSGGGGGGGWNHVPFPARNLTFLRHNLLAKLVLLFLERRRQVSSFRSVWDFLSKWVRPREGGKYLFLNSMSRPPPLFVRSAENSFKPSSLYNTDTCEELFFVRNFSTLSW